MEIAILSKGTLRIKEKNATFVVDPQEKEKAGANGIFLLDRSSQDEYIQDDSVVISGPGDYEVAGIKISGTKSEAGTVYSLKIDGLEVLVGKLSTLEKMQHKLKEYNLVAASCDVVIPSSFVTSLTSNVIVYYGDKAPEITDALGKDNVKQMTKYSVTLSKLPAEVETILLA